MDESLRNRAQTQWELVASLSDIPGGHQVIDWFKGQPEFGDAEIVSLILDRKGPSALRIAQNWHSKSAIFMFELTGWIDVDVRGFSHQNVISGLKLQRAESREVKP